MEFLVWYLSSSVSTLKPLLLGLDICLTILKARVRNAGNVIRATDIV
jgi:hypothetical protein